MGYIDEDCSGIIPKQLITMITSSGECIDRLPALIKRETQDLSVRKAYDAIFWNLPEKYVWKETPPKPESLRNYEAHYVSGMPGLYISASEKRDYE
ncbi:hypothetical protein Glove_330g130 [Diversispora epigaea]|uniref:Uncharacterized protein n=1 Tax=Diversispora epigaea TaxID=1348612 RepID=A0A397HQ43_9GLOM|nr:hypothetical protein Glove_330g130 [Diversispora epigaea]